MGSSYGSYGYGDYSGYNNYYGYNQQQGGSVLGNNTSMSMNNSQLGSASELTNQSPTGKIMDGITKTYNDGLQTEKKSGGIGDFFKGILNGIKNLFKSLADPKTWLMIAACVALCMFVPGAGVALMALGIGMAGMQIFKGVSSGNMEQAGEGTFNLGLAFLGGASGMKAGKGAEAANFSRAGTRVTEAEASLAAAQKAKDVKAIESAQKAVDTARAQMARSDASAMSSSAREAHLKNPNVSSLKTADDFKAAKSTTQNAMMDARVAVDDAQSALAAAEKTKNTAKITQAKSDLAAAESRAKQASANVHEVYLAERIYNTKDMGMGGRSWEYIKNTGTRTKDSTAMLFGRPMTSADGRTVSFWSRTPKTPEATAAEAAKPKTSSWKFWQSNKGKDESAAGAKGAEGSAASKTETGKPTIASEKKPPEPLKPITAEQQEAAALITKQFAAKRQATLQAEETAAKARMEAAEKTHGTKSKEYKEASAKAAEASAKAERFGQIKNGAQDRQLAAGLLTDVKNNTLAAEKAKAAAAADPKNAQLALEAKQAEFKAFVTQQVSQRAQARINPQTNPAAAADTTPPGMWERVKSNIAPGFIGSQSISPLFGMLGGGQGGGLLG